MSFSNYLVCTQILPTSICYDIGYSTLKGSVEHRPS